MVGLLAALQSGDATTALSYLDDSTIDAQTHPLLTDSVLAANQETFSFNEDLTKIESTSTAYKYRASISINGTDKVVEWSVVDAGDDWLVSTSDVFTRLSLDAELPHVINGTTVDAGTVPATTGAGRGGDLQFQRALGLGLGQDGERQGGSGSEGERAAGEGQGFHGFLLRVEQMRVEEEAAAVTRRRSLRW